MSFLPLNHWDISTHTQLTKQNGSWIPRLERMVESRKLCDFEKNVLLLLIGSVIQPTKVHTFVFVRVCTCVQICNSRKV